MHVKAVVHDYVVLTNSMKALPQFQAAMQAQVSDDSKVGGPVVQVDIPAVITSPAVVSQGNGFDYVEERKSGFPVAV
jgi:hypothetical protein